MGNIVWKTPEGRIVISHLAEGQDAQSLAAELQAGGGIPADWEAVAFNIEVPEGPPDALSWNGTALVLTDADAEREALAAAQREAAREAAREIEKSDRLALLCFKAGMPYPVEWRERDTLLWGIVNGDPGPVPSAPEYPPGL